VSKQELLIEARRINSKLSAVIDGEQSVPALYALLALAVHCAAQSNVSRDDALAIFSDMFASAPSSR
jgi:hypothetical protein